MSSYHNIICHHLAATILMGIGGTWELVDLTKNEIKGLFCELDDLDFKILSMFYYEGPSTRYDILQSTKKGNKNPTINRSTLYCRVDRLVNFHFLEVLKTESYKIDYIQRKKPILTLTSPKGMIASLVFRKETQTINEDFQAWIKWQKKFEIDLSKANLSWNYYFATSFLAASEFPEAYSYLPNSKKLQKVFSEHEKRIQKFTHKIFLKAYEAKKKSRSKESVPEKKSDHASERSFKNLFGEDSLEHEELTDKELRDRLINMILSLRSKGYTEEQIKSNFFRDISNIVEFYYRNKKK